MYRLVKSIIKPCLYVYFKHINAFNIYQKNKNESVIYICNHPAAFLDPVVLGSQIIEQPYYLARGESFNSPLANWFFDRTNMIPVYRKETTPDKMDQNDYMFQKCKELLARSKSLVVFPEGFSHPDLRILPLKTGTSRIALTHLKHNPDIPLKIVPVGLFYVLFGKLRTDVMVNFGPAIHVQELIKNENPKDYMDIITSACTSGLSGVLPQITKPQNDKIFRTLIKMNWPEMKSKTPDDQLQWCLELAKSVNSGTEIPRSKERNSTSRFWSFIKRIILLPITITGVILNFLPYLLSLYFSKKAVKSNVFKPGVSFITGLAIFPLIWFLQIWVVYMIWGSFWLALICLPIGMFSGFWAHKYILESRYYY